MSLVVVSFLLGFLGRWTLIFGLAAVVAGAFSRGSINQYPTANGMVSPHSPEVVAVWGPFLASLFLIGGIAIVVYLVSLQMTGGALLAAGAHALGWGHHRLHMMPWQLWAGAGVVAFFYFLPALFPTQADMDQLAQLTVLGIIFVIAARS